jgi:hypothetical protein
MKTNSKLLKNLDGGFWGQVFIVVIVYLHHRGILAEREKALGRGFMDFIGDNFIHTHRAST